MKYLVVSDLHGNEAFLNYIYHLVEVEQPDKIIFLGDMMGLSDNRILFDLLDKYKDKIVYIKGNNDFTWYLDNELLPYHKEIINDKIFIFTHGHLYSPSSFDDYDVYVSGHTHINKLEEENNKIYFNPGSLAHPRNKSLNSYGIITEDDLIIKDVDGGVIKKLKYRK